MLKYAKVINEETKQCEVGLGDEKAIFREIEKVNTWQEIENDVLVEKSDKYVETITIGEWYESIGMTKQEVEQDYAGNWYLAGFAPTQPISEYNEQQSIKRSRAYIERTDPLTLRKMRKQALGEWTSEDEKEYVAQIKAISEQIASEFPYNSEEPTL